MCFCLHTVILFQVFLSNTNHSQPIVVAMTDTTISSDSGTWCKSHEVVISSSVDLHSPISRN